MDYILLSFDRMAADSDDLMAFSLSPSQVTAKYYIFHIFVHTNFCFIAALDK